MNQTSGRLLGKLAVSLLAIILISVTCAWAKSTTPEEARNVVTNWLGLDAKPMDTSMSPQVEKVQSYPGPDGITAYYVVFLNPRGFVIVPADDLVEPIIGFLPARKTYNPSPRNPLGALVNKDVPGRVLHARKMEAMSLKAGESLAPASLQGQAQRKWAWLTDPVFSAEALKADSLSAVSNIRVPPFIKSRWSQTTVSSQACYNYYTPPYAAGTAGNYPCGCVATAMGQLMRYFRRPQFGVGTAGFTIWVNGVRQTAYLRGGNGYGGPYDWANMVLQPSFPSTAERQAIGALLHDAGLSVNMSYSKGGSGAYMTDVADALIGVFGYQNAKIGVEWGASIPTADRDRMVNPNLHAKFPVIFGITDFSAGHAIICDGYGLQAGTYYHHLNMGWGGYDDAWYNLPNIDAANYAFDTVDSCIYNVYYNGRGEIIAGRVRSASGAPIKGAIVTATLMIGSTPGNFTRTATTNSKGYYALTKLRSNRKYSVSVSKSGYTFPVRTRRIGTSFDYSTTTGNVWNFNFTGTP